MRVLWVTSEIPHHTAWGGRIRQAHLLDAVSARADVDLLVAGRVEDERVRSACASVTEVSVDPVVPEPPWTRRRHTILPSSPAELRVGRPHLQALRDAFPPGSDHDVVVVQHNELVPLLPRHASVDSRRWILELHHLLSVRHGHEANRVRGRSRAYHRVEMRRGRRLERTLAGRADLVVVCSAEDAAALGGDVAVVPNGVDLDGFPATPVPTEPRIVFTGHLGYEPNIDAVRWLAEEVMPVVRRAEPAVVVDVVGALPTEEVRAVADRAGFELHADVPSVVPHLRAARVAVVPIHIGSGTRLKALDAMASGRPVVGTTIGLEGIGLVDGHDALVADDARAFAAAVLRVLQDDVLAAALGRAGRATAERDYGWDAVGSRYADVVLSS